MNKAYDSLPLTLTVEDVTRLLRIGRSTAYELVRLESAV